MHRSHSDSPEISTKAMQENKGYAKTNTSCYILNSGTFDESLCNTFDAISPKAIQIKYAFFKKYKVL